ncbi:MAG: alpha/beta hydrolase [Pseudomonadota bacterium]
MDDLPALGYLQASYGWQSTAGGGPLLRGRRTAAGADAPTLHFLHGNGFCGGVYWPFLRHLLPDYGLFCHDLEGHGASEAPARYSGPAAIIARVPKVIADQQLDRGTLIGIGHSFGAAVTMAVAARNPGLFRALVLLDPILLPTRSWLYIKLLSALGRNPMAEAARRRRNRWACRDDALEHLRGRGIYRGWGEEGLRCFVEHATRDAADGSRVLCCPRELEAAIFENPVYPWRLLPRVDVPILFLHGAGSYPFMAPSARKAKCANPRVEARALPGGHCFMLEDPPAAAAVVRRFLERHACRAGA